MRLCWWGAGLAHVGEDFIDDVRVGDISKDKAPNRKRSLVWRFGAFFLARLNTLSCCLSKRFSAIVALVPPDLSDFANSTKRCIKRKATDFMSGMLSRHPATTRLHIDLLFCDDYQFAMHRAAHAVSFDFSSLLAALRLVAKP